MLSAFYSHIHVKENSTTNNIFVNLHSDEACTHLQFTSLGRRRGTILRTGCTAKFFRQRFGFESMHFLTETRERNYEPKHQLKPHKNGENLKNAQSIDAEEEHYDTAEISRS